MEVVTVSLSSLQVTVINLKVGYRHFPPGLRFTFPVRERHRYQIMVLDDRGMYVNNLPQSCYLTVQRPTVDVLTITPPSHIIHMHSWPKFVRILDYLAKVWVKTKVGPVFGPWKGPKVLRRLLLLGLLLPFSKNA